MTPDPKLRAALEPAWSELREQRLLGRIAEGRRQGAHRRRRRVVLAGGALFLAGAAAAAIIGVHHGAQQLAARRSGESAPRLTLADGLEATLTSDGDVQIDEQTAARVRLRQRAGAARYVVRHDPARDFLVTAGQVTIRVRGTILSVAMGAGTVEVNVERGRVEISDRLRTRDLVAGESLTIPSMTAPPPPPSPSPPEESPPAVAHELPSPEPAPRAPVARPSGSDLLARADAARAAGHSAEAARSLEAFASGHPRDSTRAGGAVHAGAGRSSARSVAARGRGVRSLRGCARRRPAGGRRARRGRAGVACCGGVRSRPGRRARLPGRAPDGTGGGGDAAPG